MPAAIEMVLGPDDEKQLLRFLENYTLTAYPNRIPPDWTPLPVGAAIQDQLTEPAYYLAAEQLSPIVVRTIRRGHDRGSLEIDETASPVIHFDRSLYDEIGQLRSGKLWTEINVTGDVQKNHEAFPDSYRRMWMALREFLVGQSHRSKPSGFLIGHQAARLYKSGTILREQGRKGALLVPYR